MMRPIAVAAVVASVFAASEPDLVYDFEWRVTASVSRVERGEVHTVQAERKGTARLGLRHERDGVLAFDWSGPEGTGSGVVGPGGPEHVTFPLPAEVGLPPLPPYRGVGQFTFEGAREHPTAFTVTWVEAFRCRTAPRACDDITAWERAFAGIARRVKREM
jgi:hypothetical protein